MDGSASLKEFCSKASRIVCKKVDYIRSHSMRRGDTRKKREDCEFIVVGNSTLTSKMLISKVFKTFSYERKKFQ